MQLHQFGLLTDENIDPVLVAFLRTKGFDVLDVKEQHWEGRKDKELLMVAHQQGRVVVRHDGDFGTLIFTQGVPFIGVFYLRPGHFDAAPHLQSIDAVLQQEIDLVAPFLLIAENRGETVKIRVRLLP